MKFSREDWSQESVPLHKSKESQGKDLITAKCDKCGRQIVFIDGKPTKHDCKKD